MQKITPIPIKPNELADFAGKFQWLREQLNTFENTRFRHIDVALASDEEIRVRGYHWCYSSEDGNHEHTESYPAHWLYLSPKERERDEEENYDTYVDEGRYRVRKETTKSTSQANERLRNTEDYLICTYKNEVRTKHSACLDWVPEEEKLDDQ